MWLLEKAKRWRSVLSTLALVIVLFLLVYWGWQNRELLVQVFLQLGLSKFALVLVWINLAYLVALLAFVLLIRSTGYKFTFGEGYHALNLAQVAGMLPGGIWGAAGLAGWLWSKGLRKQDSAMVVTLNLIFSLGACVLFSVVALTATWGWIYALVPIALVGGWFLARAPLETLRRRFFPEGAALPSARAGLQIIGLSVLVWAIECACFAWLLTNARGDANISPLFVASAYAAAYVVGFVALIAPAGLGVREGVLVALLGSAFGVDQVLALALAFRLAQTLVQWLNVLISWALRFGVREVRA
jgi:uncharacterized membrane protein YbhN (UPF0104 family)